MLWNPPPIKVPRRRPPRLKAPPVVVPTVNQIIRVTHGDDIDRLVVTLSRPLTSYDDFDKMFASSRGGEVWLFPVAFNNEDPLNLLFMMNDDVSDNLLWRVPGPGNYHFGDGEPLVEPFNGDIE